VDQGPPSDIGDIEFGPLVEEDLGRISELIISMGPKRGDQRLRDKSTAYYRWMYLDNPAGEAFVHSARRHGKVVSTFAVAPKRVQIDGRQVVLGKTMDMFTDPAYQGLGLIKRCTQAAFRSAMDAGLAGWYVTPSVNSYPIFTGKWGYREDFKVIYRAQIFDYATVLDAALGRGRIGRHVGRAIDATLRLLPRSSFAIPEGSEVRELDSFGPDADRLWDAVSSGYRVAIIRNADYLNWRYVDNPGDYSAFGVFNQDRLTGIIVVTTTLRRGVVVGEIVDYVCGVDDRKTFKLLIDIAVDHLRGSGCALAQAWSIPGTAGDRRLRAAGLRLPRAETKFLISPAYPDPIIYRPESWFLTQGDGNDV